MKTKFFAFALSLLFAMPCVLCAEEYDVYGQKVISGRGLQADITAVPRGSYTFVAESANSKCQIKFVRK